MDAKIIGERLRMHRKDNRLTQVELGKLVGLSGQAIAQYEKGDRAPSLELIYKLAKVLNIEAWLLYADGEDFQTLKDISETNGGRVYLTEEEMRKILPRNSGIDLYLRKAIELSAEANNLEVLYSEETNHIIDVLKYLIDKEIIALLYKRGSK